MRKPRISNYRRWAGVWGPAAFVGAAVIGGRREPGYSHVENHVSGLAARNTASAIVMVPGFLALGLSSVLLPIDDEVVHRLAAVAGAATVAAGLSQCSTVDCPMPFGDDDYGPTDVGHAAASVIGFACWVALPALASKRLGPCWYRRLSAGLTVPTAVAWVVAGHQTRTSRPTRGLSQRVFLAHTFVWYAATTVRALTCAEAGH